MARQKKRRVSKTQFGEMNMAMYGKEPTFPYDHKIERSEYLTALNWYAAILSRDESKAYVAKYLREQKRKDDLKKLANISPAYITPTYGAIARMLSNDYLIPDTGAKWLDENLKKLFENPMTHKIEVK